jgi:tetratricopeptide (TPR) repeat protein
MVLPKPFSSNPHNYYTSRGTKEVLFPATIAIREQQPTDKGFAAVLSFDDRTEYQLEITDPFSPQEEKELEWYFQEWLLSPLTDTAKAKRAAQSIATYGKSLFKQVFHVDFNAYSQYHQLRENLSQVQIEIVSQTPEFQALHWEAIQDPQLPQPLAVECVMVRKYIRSVPVSTAIEPSPVINLLVVTARPDRGDDVGYRTVSRPLIDAIANSQLRVNVELLRPGTYEALERHLQAKGEGFYHIVHFDAHGALQTFEQMQARYGRSDLQPYEGVKAFLLLEGESKGQAYPVEAGELAALFAGKQIPVCILNACQSGKEKPNPPAPLRAREGGDGGGDDDLLPSPGRGGVGGEVTSRETSLGSRLMAAGMQMVVAMGYSLTGLAATMLMEQVYRHLFDRQEMNEAIRLGRRELFNRKGRKAYFDRTIDLEDWLLPVVYSHQAVNFNLREFTPEEEEEYERSLGRQKRFQPPTYGFVGRDLEILQMEKALLRHNILLLQGMGGTGKTTLLTYLRSWWQTTHFAEQVFYFGYDRQPWTLTEILEEIAHQIYDRFDVAKFKAMDRAAQLPKLLAKLRSEPHLLILDNLESITGQPLAIPNTLPEAERQQILDFLERLVGGKTRVVLSSRCGESWLQAPTFRTNIYQLQGLDLEARTVLAEKILERHVAANRISKITQDEDFQRLMQVLAGYPLAMEVVLANLKERSPTEILAGLQAADIKLDVPSEDRTKSILKCVEYAHSNLSVAAPNLLLCLAPFNGFIVRNFLANYIQELQDAGAFKDNELEELDEAIQVAIDWGLLSPTELSPSSSPGTSGEKDSPLLAIEPILSYFVKTQLAIIDEARRSAFQVGFKNHYLGLANYYCQLMESQDAGEQQIGQLFCQWEYDNLDNALEICLKDREDISIYFCFYKYFEAIADKQSQLKLSEKICQFLAQCSPATLEDKLGYQAILAIYRLSNCYLETEQYRLAKESYERVLEILPTIKVLEEREKQGWIASTYHQLGMVAYEQREWEEAKEHYQQALAIKLEFSDRYHCASTYHELGMVACEQREWEEAKEHYQQALAISLEFGDRYHCASTYYQLGIANQALGEWEQARRNYQQALKLFIEFGDLYNCASTYHQLGSIDEEEKSWEEAKRNYQQALEINIEYGDRYSCARTYHNLGIVAYEEKEFEQARHNYQQALEINIEYGDRYSCAKTYHCLGMVAQAERAWEEARGHYQQALAIKLEYGDRYHGASTYQQLGSIAEEEREWEEARRNYQQALEIYLEFGDRYACASTYHNLGIVAQEEKQWEEARHNYQQALEIYLEFGDRYQCASTYFQLGKLSEKLRKLDAAKTNYLQNLQITAEFNDRQGLATSLKNLARFYRVTQDESIWAAAASMFGVNAEELKRGIDLESGE